MSEYGIIVKDTLGNQCKLTPDLANVVGSASVTMPTGLVDTNKYYTSLDLPGAYNVPVADIGVILNVFRLAVGVNAFNLESGGGWYFMSYYANAAYAHYQHAMATGIMTAWTPGDFSDYLDVNDMDPILCINPVAHWEQMGASAFTAVKMFAAMRYDVFDGSASVYVEAYQIGTNGVSKLDYVVAMRRREAE